MKAQIGLIGLGVMGENLLMNMESKGFTVACYNRSTEKVRDFIEGRAKGKNIIGAYSLEELVASLVKPRKVMIMVKAGAAVDAMIDKLTGAIFIFQIVVVVVLGIAGNVWKDMESRKVRSLLRDF